MVCITVRLVSSSKHQPRIRCIVAVSRSGADCCSLMSNQRSNGLNNSRTWNNFTHSSRSWRMNKFTKALQTYPMVASKGFCVTNGACQCGHPDCKYNQPCQVIILRYKCDIVPGKLRKIAIPIFLN